MKIRVQLFTSLKEVPSAAKIAFDVREQEITCEDLLRQLKGRYRGLSVAVDRCYFAKNGAYANRHTLLHEGDEVAILPPVSSRL